MHGESPLPPDGAYPRASCPILVLELCGAACGDRVGWAVNLATYCFQKSVSWRGEARGPQLQPEAGPQPACGLLVTPLRANLGSVSHWGAGGPSS